MPVHLLDINVLLAFSWDTHIHHELVGRWMSQFQDTWATCPVTQCGFIRISSNPKLAPHPASVSKAIELLHEMTAHPKHAFWPDSLDLSTSRFSSHPLHGHQQVTDAYLFSLAISNGGRLVTLDAGVASLARDQSQRDAIILLGTL